ncbi:CapA family protein [Accumulibacter sp.]|uniref:CapA family protein n=1 Tax=Accumulibacter sp. TaxID=2053492 RepID=UPI0025EB3929|nr:CapA family protein [Accumulibacter sp.]MCM8596776.1 CapA family protein [Accumulibacter sp.]MCM8624690.1 CapA family protein [Accumulibacter sp.]MDS4050924.1 CapA family protein [Accumulibacter sp.]
MTRVSRTRLLVLAIGVAYVLSAASEPLSLVFAGDIMLDDGPGRLIARGGDPLAGVAALLAGADYAIGNLECPIATVGKPLESKIASFRAHPRVLETLAGRFAALGVANNHSGDYGRDAFRQTLDLVTGHGIAVFGGGENLAAAHRPLLIDADGLRIAVLAYNEFKPRCFEAGADWPGIAWSEDTQVIADIRAARRAGARIVIPFMHWGWEREAQPSLRQRQLARAMIDAGAELVVGGHPHVTQGAEYYRGKLIVYSLGNFVFDGFDYPAARTGWLLRLKLDGKGLLAWDTVVVDIDEHGSPRPRPDLPSPCGLRGDLQIRECRPAVDEPSRRPQAGLQEPTSR